MKHLLPAQALAGQTEAPDLNAAMVEHARRVLHDPPWMAAVAQSREILAIHARAQELDAEQLKDIEPPPPAPSPTSPLPPPPDTYAVQLSQEAGRLISWYRRITHHRPEYVVEGIVYEALERAHEAYAAGNQGDDSFDMVLEDVLHASSHRSERFAKLLSSPRAAHVEVDGKASSLLSLFATGVSRPINDVASAAIIYALEYGLGVDEDHPTGENTSRAEKEQRNRFFVACEAAFERRMALRRVSA